MLFYVLAAPYHDIGLTWFAADIEEAYVEI